ncbi:PREDICTED: uncharacterized protein LOC108773959 [Cyphomyrmex costatus]|uniref:uncharacterized protein LOC108773959 n=1 Tax=Cyphomyrmex costatus TaxID=456900 RepID=UPI0008524552|nr:PREDICTED: uncharacterized protein LOC108773959 [Cyphomyrmex costatus]
METKLDAVTLRAWEQEGNVESRTLNNFVDYLQKRCLMLERLEARAKEGSSHVVDGSDKQRAKNRSPKSSQGDKSTSLAISSENGKCFLCDGEHFIYYCKDFIAMSVDDRIKEVRRLKLCFNCLRNDHYVKSCKMGSCHECSGRPNTLCHLPTKSKEDSKEAEPISTHSQSACQIAVHLSANAPVKRRVIVATARMHAIHPNGSSVPCRVLITKDLPSVEIPREALQVPSNLKLADREFDKPGTVDILLGAEYFYELLETGKIELGADRPVVQNTKLGWIVAGPLALSANSVATVTNKVASLCFEQGGPETATIRSETERRCEELFYKTTKRDDSGRFIVRLPIVEGTKPLGESRDIAEKRLKQMERRFRSNVSLHEQYANFMREYEELGHMSRVVDEER